MSVRSASAGLMATLALALAGCPALLGLDKDFQEVDDGSASGDDSGGSDRATGADGTVTDAAGSDAATGPDTATGTDTGAGGDTGGGADSGVDAKPDTGKLDSGFDARVDGSPTGTLPCGAAGNCQPPNVSVCCYGDAQSTTCIVPSGSCFNAHKIRCHVATECGANQVCCAEINGGTLSGTIDCQDTASCPVTAAQTILCDPNVGTSCPGTTTCQPTSFLNVPSSYYQCK